VRLPGRRDSKRARLFPQLDAPAARRATKPFAALDLPDVASRFRLKLVPEAARVILKEAGIERVYVFAVPVVLSAGTF
jgi:hypothetical protein